MPEVMQSPEPIVVLRHDYHDRSPLHAWSPVPAERLHAGELLAIHAFGSLLEGIRSPQHNFVAVWRDPDPARLLEAERAAPPTGILFGATCGVAPYETPADWPEQAAQFLARDRAGLRLDLARTEAGDLRLHRIEVDLHDAASPSGRNFRSCWQGSEIRTLDLSFHFDPPATRLDPFRFHLQARLPRRYNQRAPIEREMVRVEASGGAMPIPSWMNY